MLSDNQRNALQVMEYGYPTMWAQLSSVPHDQIQNGSEASRIIGGILGAVFAENGGLWPWKYWTKQAVCAQALFESKGNIHSAERVLTPSLGKIKALRFQRNENGKRVDLSTYEQREALRKQLNAVMDDVMKALREGKEQKLDGEQKLDDQQQQQQDDKQDDQQKIHPWLAFVRKVREFCAARKADGHELDEWGLRQAEYGAKMLKVGIPMDALKHAATMHFPPEARRALGVKEFDVMAFRKDKREDGFHAVLPYVEALIDAGVPAALVGPKGTGKTTLAKQIAERKGLRFTMISMTSATSPSAFFGRPKIGGDGGVVESEWSQIMREGGLVLLDEMDAADENLLLIANSAIANRVFYNQQTAQMIDVHPNTVFVAGMNTLGLGAGRDYNSRNKLDAATLDRWNMGRVQVRLDERVEDAIFYGILNS